MTMAVGGLALHWGGACNRFSEEDLRLKSMYGLAADWPLDWHELERYYWRPSGVERRRRAQPVCRGPPLRSRIRSRRCHCPTTCSRSRAGPNKSGLPFNALPLARNLSPFDGRGALLRLRHLRRSARPAPATRRTSPSSSCSRGSKIVLHDRTLVRKLVLDEAAADRRRGAGGAPGSARRAPGVSRAASSWSPPATAGARTCCFCRPTHGSPTGWPIAPAWSAAT